MNIEFESVQDAILSALDGVLSFVVLFAVLGLGLRVKEWIIRRAVERRKHLMAGWDYSEPDEKRTESITRVLLTAARAIWGVLAIVLLLILSLFRRRTFYRRRRYY